MPRRSKRRSKDAIEHPTKKFTTTKEENALFWKEFSARTSESEKEIGDIVRTLNHEQEKEVLANLEGAITKGVDPSKLFDINKWVSITVDALTPTLEKLFVAEGLIAASKVGKPELNPLSDNAAKVALHESVQLMAQSYNATTLATLEEKINQGLAQGDGFAAISDGVKQIYEWSDTWRADRVARTESYRTANMAQREAWKQSGVVHTLIWYTAGDHPCEFCEFLEGRVVSIDDLFSKGDTVSAQGNSMVLDYSDVEAPPLHPQCQCIVLPDEVSI